jgi:carbon monoxide dehydrogenase subunit G
MELDNEFDVGVPIDQAWAILTDLERIAPCMPGAQLQEVEGDEYRGIVKVKVGPITAQYKGTATFVELDESTHTAKISATGRDTRGQGNASAAVVATLEDRGDSTHVSVLTDLTVTGKVAQFGRGVLADVSGKLMDQFVSSLEETVLADLDTSPAAPGDDGAAQDDAAGSREAGEPASTSGVRTIDAPEAEPVDLVGAAGSSVLKRVLPALGALIAVLAFGYLLKRRRRNDS